MKPRQSVIASLVLSFALMLAAPVQATHQEMLKHMAALNRAYLASLVTTTEGDLEYSKTAVGDLAAKWDLFKKDYEGADREVFVSKEAIQDVDRLIRQALQSITEKKNLSAAHETLEEIRESMFYFRKGNRLAYYFASLDEFLQPLQAMADLCAKSPHPMPEPDFKRMELLFEQARSSWRELRQTTFPPELFSFDQAQAEVQRQATADVWAGLGQLEDILASHDSKAMALLLTEIRNSFERLQKVSEPARASASR